MSSPNLNNLIILGSIFVYLGVFAGGLDETLVSIEGQAIACQVNRTGLFSLTWCFLQSLVNQLDTMKIKINASV